MTTTTKESYINSNAFPFEKMEGYYYVPENNRYVFNVEGVLFDTKLKRFKTWYVQKPSVFLDGRYRNIKRGYKIARLIRPDGTKRHVFQHRLIAWLKIPYVGDHEKLLINHIDGDGSNNHFTNLEWCNYSENTKHAYDNGHCKNTRSVDIFDHTTGQQLTFKSIIECAKYLNVPHSYVQNRVMRNPGKIYDNRFSFRYTDSGSNWSNEKAREHNSGPYFAYNVLTRVLTIAETQVELSRLTNILVSQISAAIVGVVNYPIDGFMFGEFNSDVELPTFTDEQLELFKLDRKKPWQCGWVETDMQTNKTRVILYSTIMEERGLSLTHVYRILNKGKTPCGRFLYRKINPEATDYCPPPM